ncbi:MAG TPA: type II/IV secretion system protein, partial [Candidatus Saccharimonadales bacterium]|nr:type II/IV secretion system protein [Candidatus Saccharimonadales bacterium]
PRLLDMNVEPFLIASTVRVVVAQRLVRRLCTHCRKLVEPSAAEVKEITKTMGVEKAGGYAKIHEYESQARKDNLIGEAEANSKTSSTASGIAQLYKASDEGCEVCNHTGYKGRIGIYEVLSNSEEIQRLILTNTSSEVLEATAIKGGMLPMHLDGFVKALVGLTTIEEVLRVTTAEGA